MGKSVIFFLLSFFDDSARASISDVMGPGARNKAMGLANGVTAAGAFSAKTNPAALAKIKKNKFSGGYSFNTMNLATTGHTSVNNLSDNFSDDNYENSSRIIVDNPIPNYSSSFGGIEFGATFSLGKKTLFWIGEYLTCRYLSQGSCLYRR